MYTPENYFWGMLAYYLAAAGLLVCCWHFTRFIGWRHVRNLLLLFIATLILMPAPVDPDLTYLAPAWFVSVFEGITGEPDGFARAGRPILIIYLFAAVVYLVGAILWRKRGGKAAAATQEQREAHAG